MADNKKIYSIQINGIEQSIGQVEALNKQLDKLEQRMKALSSVSVPSGGGSPSRGNTALSEEERVQKEINKLKEEGQRLDAKIAASQNEIYKRVDATKQLYKETIADQKAIAAQERLTANAYSNTMQGMKQQLADLKAVINTTDIGDSDQIKKMTQQANELTNKLKEMEQAYGQFGRNVGNYQSAFDGLDKLVVEVGNVTREFSSAREASRTLRNELVTLEAQGKGNTKEADNLRKAFYRLQSAMDDATKTSKAMDEAMDWMQSFGAISSMGNGLKAFFGFDDNEIQRSIQRLVSLQNVLQGIESIRKQMDTGEGIGKLLTKGSENVDKLVAGITGARIGVDGLEKSSKIATIAVRGLSLALKTIGLGVATAALTGLMSLVESLGKKISDFFTGTGGKIASVEGVAAAQVDAFNEKLRYQQSLLSSGYMNGFISDVDYARRNVLLLNEAISDNATQLSRDATAYWMLTDEMKAFNDAFSGMLDYGKGEISIKSDFLDLTSTIKNIDGAKTAWKEFEKAVRTGQDVITANGANSLGEWLASFIVTAKDARQQFEQIGQVIAGNWVSEISLVNIKTDEGKRKLRELIKELNTDEVTHSVMMNLDKYIPDERVRVKIENIIKYAKQLEAGLNFMTSDSSLISTEGYNYWEQVRIDSMKKGSDKIRAQIALNAKKEKDELIKQYGDLPEERIRQIDAKYDRMLKEQLEAEAKTRSSEARKRAKEAEEAEKELRQLKIAQMRNGFEKEKAQLEEERRERIAKLDQMNITAKKKAELLLEINKTYDKKIADAKRDWAYNIVKTYEDMYARIEQLSSETFEREADTAKANTESRRFNASNSLQLPSYGSQSLEKGTRQLGKTGLYDAYYSKLEEIERNASERLAKIEQERLSKELDFNKKEEELRHKREVSIETSNAVIEALMREGLDDDSTQEQWDRLEEQMRQSLEGMRGALVDAYNNGEIDFKQFCTLVEQEQAAHNANMNSLEKEYAAQSKAVEDNLLKEKLNQRKDYYTEMINVVRREESRIANISKRATKTNSWGFINIKEAKKELNQALEGYRNTAREISALKAQLKVDLASNKISSEDFLIKDSELNEAQSRIHDAIESTEDDIKDLPGKAIRVIAQYTQQVMSMVTGLLNTVWDAQDAAYDKMMEQLDKDIDAQEERYQKMEELADEHKDKMNDIEDELSTARGDRRQHLIDQLNAEIAAQRNAVNEQKKAEKEKEKLEKKKEKEELAQKKREHKRQVVQAIINAAMATLSGLSTQPFIPVGIAMGALAASLGAAQVAIVASQKYAKGGLLEGPSHREGGIPVGRTGIELEGKEYVVRKKSTTQNIDLLDYINKSERKLDLSDFIDFYTSGRPIRAISSQRAKYADGGVLPTLRTDIDVSDRLIQSLDSYARRPVQVSVVDIIDRTQQVNDVRVMAGYNE